MGRRPKLRYLIALIWILFTVALAAWWMVFGLRQSERLLELGSETATELARHQKMLISEGAILIALVITGGLFLLYYMVRERRHFKQVKEFFAAYTHDLKTSLASLRLQAETLQEELKDHEQNRVVSRLLKDTVRLELQLENSLSIANPTAQLFLEGLSLRKTLASFLDHWPELRVDLKRDCELLADARALESILKNILQNSVSHGEATQVTISAEPCLEEQVRVRIVDNGKGFHGAHADLGKPFHRHTSRSGSGVGLYLAHHLAKQMKGSLTVIPSASGFAVELMLKGHIL